MSKRATAKDVANLAGVSRSTVSFVLNDVAGMRISEETRQRVLDAARSLDYHPNASARRMVTGRTRTIGLVLRQSPEQVFADHFLPRVLHGLSEAAAASDYHTLFKPIPPDEPTGTYARLIGEHHVDGLVVSGPRFDDEDLLKMHAEGALIVMMGQLPESGIPFVDVDNVGGALGATRHLLGLGRRRVALITNANPIYTAASQRLSGYRQALETAGRGHDESLVIYGNFTPQSGLVAMQRLLALEPIPDAVVVASDTVALGALQAIRLAGLHVPDDIAIVGFDDIPLAEFTDPPLTTMRLPAYALGWGAAELLIHLIAGEEERPHPYEMLETELVIRRSCGADQAPPAP